MNDDPMNEPTENTPRADNVHTDEQSRALPPPMPPPPPRPSWWHVPVARDPGDRKVGGVVGGVAKAFGFDVRTSRIAAAIGAVAVPGVLALYIAAWILLPTHPASAKPLSVIITERRRRPLLVVLGLVAIFTGFGSWSFFGGVGWGFALVATGVVLWLAPNFGSGLRPGVSALSNETTTAAGSAGSTDETIVAGATGVVVATRPPRRRRRPVQAIALAGAAATALVIGIGNTADWWHVEVFTAVVTFIGILVAGTILGVIINRSWFGVPMLIVLSIVLGTLLLSHPNLDGGFGDRTITPVSVHDAQRVERLGAGRLTIDLTAVPLGEQPLILDATVGFGQLRIVVPAGDTIVLDGHLGAGHVVIDGTEIISGFRYDDSRTIAPPTTSATATTTAGGTTGAGKRPARTITLHLEVGGGEIAIERVG